MLVLVTESTSELWPVEAGLHAADGDADADRCWHVVFQHLILQLAQLLQQGLSVQLPLHFQPRLLQLAHLPVQ